MRTLSTPKVPSPRFLYCMDGMEDDDEAANQHGQIEEALEDIYGVPTGCEVTNGSFHDMPFDVLFFDYGGIGNVGHGMFDSMTNYLLKHAENHPSNCYIVTSEFTWKYMREALDEFEGRVHNVFCAFGEDETFTKGVEEALRKTIHLPPSPPSK
jgi:hypothetical protein